MGLLETKQETPARTPVVERRDYTRKRDYEGLVLQLADRDPTVRRWGARELSAYPDSTRLLCARLAEEQDLAVREGLLDSLVSIGGEEVVHGLIPLLSSEDVALRNAVVEGLQQLPEALAPHMPTLLTDEDPDVRILTLDILQNLQHDDTGQWLIQVICTDEHPNVLGTAVDRLIESGNVEVLPALRALRDRVTEHDFLTFAIDEAIAAIEGSA